MIDACFDSVVLSGEAPSLNLRSELTAREVAWVYYHAMLNTRLVNATVTWCCTYLVLAALALALRSKPHHRARWRMLVPMALVGVGAYAFVIVPRYHQLRVATSLDPAFFDDWEPVAIARIGIVAAIFVGFRIAFPVLCDLAREEAFESGP